MTKSNSALDAALGRDEHTQQVRLFEWAELATLQHPELALLYAVPNFAGFHGSKLARLRSGARAKAEGRKPGVPDVVLPVPRGGYGALYVEMKKLGGGSLSVAQRWWLAQLDAAGNRAVRVVGWEAARDEILHYLALARVMPVARDAGGWDHG